VIAYFDTSAVVPLLIDEPGSEAAGRLWDETSRAMGIRLVYPEARAALAQARRMERITAAQLRAAVKALEERYLQLDIVEIDNSLALEAGELAETLALRGYDAVHLTAARRISDDDLVVVAGDRALLTAAKALGLKVAAIA